MLKPYLAELMKVTDIDYECMVGVVSSILMSAGGDAGKIMFDAYRAVMAEKNPDVRKRKLEFIERVRVSYVTAC